MTTPEPDNNAAIPMPPDAASRAAYLAEVHREFAASAAETRRLRLKTAFARIVLGIANQLSGGKIPGPDAGDPQPASVPPL